MEDRPDGHAGDDRRSGRYTPRPTAAKTHPSEARRGAPGSGSGPSRDPLVRFGLRDKELRVGWRLSANPAGWCRRSGTRGRQRSNHHRSCPVRRPGRLAVGGRRGSRHAPRRAMTGSTTTPGSAAARRTGSCAGRAGESGRVRPRRCPAAGRRAVRRIRRPIVPLSPGGRWIGGGGQPRAPSKTARPWIAAGRARP